MNSVGVSASTTSPTRTVREGARRTTPQGPWNSPAGPSGPSCRRTGLGLATVYGAVRDMHGMIDVTSEVGSGTTFTVWFPLTSSAAPERASRGDAGTHSGDILILDDPADVLDFATAVLERAGFGVTSATTSKELLRRLEERPFDLVIIDAFVDATPAVQTLELIHEIRRDQQTMMWSGLASRSLAIAWGADEFLAKPFEADALRRAVSSALGLPAPQPPSPR
jgi:two-component system cell cycle sensor histidine kinase/response regulator CckA